MKIVLCYIQYKGKVLLIKRRNEPYRGYYALIGGKVEKGEHLEDAAIREVYEECGLVASGATLVASSSEIVTDANTGELLYEYDMSLLVISIDCLVTTASCEGELYWMDRSNFLASDEVVPTDIDLVKRYIDSYSEEVFHYIVERNELGKYSILSIDR